MKSTKKAPVKPLPASRKSDGRDTSLAIGRKLMEIKKISGTGEMTEINLALFRHLK